MISVIICSKDPIDLEKVCLDIDTTIGVQYEIVSIDNSEGKLGICEAYNLGAKQSKFNLLCFMHEDIRFHTNGWGKIVDKVLLDERVGAVGVAGSTNQIKAPAAWWALGDEFNRINILHTLPGGGIEAVKVNPHSEVLSEVAVLDGLWICCRKEVWEQCKFDEKTFPEFHFYDIDFSAQIFFRFKNYVTFEVMIEHFSKGTINRSWLKSIIKYQDKYNSALPFGIKYINNQIDRGLRKNSIYRFTKLMVELDMPKRIIFSYFTNLVSYGVNNRQLLSILKTLLLNRGSGK